MKENGRPAYTDDFYEELLHDMKPFLKLGETINMAMHDAGLEKHQTTIYEKYRLNDWFAKKIDIYRSYPGKIVNNILTKTLIAAEERLAQGIALTDEDWRNVRFMAEKHRTAQQFFVNRTETAESDPAKIGKVLDDIESDYNDVRQQAEKQMVAIDAPVQDKEQAGPASNVSAELPTA